MSLPSEHESNVAIIEVQLPPQGSEGESKPDLSVCAISTSHAKDQVFIEQFSYMIIRTYTSLEMRIA